VQQQILRAHVALLTKFWRAGADYATSESDAKRARRADADYTTSERDAKRALRADADQKKALTQSGLLAASRRQSSLVYTAHFQKESKQAHCAWALMTHAACSSAPLSGAAPFLRTCQLG
jgi:hypothetical protein